MIGLVMPSRCITHASESWLIVQPFSFASAWIASTASYARSLPIILFARKCEPSEYLPSVGCCPSRLYFPERNPPASGLHGITPNPYVFSIGKSSRSMRRSSRLYGGCSHTNRFSEYFSEHHRDST